MEKDRDLSLLLKKKFGNKINIINKDILNCFNSFKFSEPIKVFGNLPYNISTKILISFLKEDNLNNFFKKFVFIFQKEVADRILAEENSNKYGRLSVLTSWKMNKLKIVDIHPNSFYPIPKVWSTLLTLTPKLKFIKLKKTKNLEHITNIFFNQRRKMIKKPMKLLFKDFEIIAEKLNLDLSLRPQNISKNKFLDVCKIYEDLN